MNVLDCTDPSLLGAAVDQAIYALSRGELIVLPTDTVYGIGADAFDAGAVAALLAAKGRGRQMPPPVLIGDPQAVDGLAIDVSAQARALMSEFWPGALTIICRAQPSLAWDLGDTGGTVALRMPDHEVTLQLLRRSGPLAVSSANRTGQDAAITIADARVQLGDSVAVYLDAGRSPGQRPSTIVDATGPNPLVVRLGAVGLQDLIRVAPGTQMAEDRG